MGLFWGKQQARKEYYKDQADKLSRDADRVLEETGDRIKAAQLRNTADKALNQARGLDEQLNDIADDLNK